MKGGYPKAGQVGSAQLLLDPLAHFLSRVLGVSDGQDLVGPGVALADQAGDRLVRTVVFPVPAPAIHQHGPVNMLNSFALTIVRFEHPWPGNWFCDWHLQEHTREG